MKNKGPFVIAIFIAAALLMVGGAVAHTDETETAEGKGLVEEKISCDELNDEQLEAIGEYLMEQMHPGEAHDLMHSMMGIEEGTPYHGRFHVNLAQAMYCDTAAAVGTGAARGSGGMMGTGGMMPMMRMMPMMNAMAGQGMMGSGGYSSSYPNLVNVLYVVLLLGLIGLVYFWLIKLWKGKDTKRRK